MEEKRANLDQTQLDYDENPSATNLSTLLVAKDSLQLALDYEVSLLHQR